MKKKPKDDDKANFLIGGLREVFPDVIFTVVDCTPKRKKTKK